MKQPILFQKQLHETDLGIDIYSFKYREHDPTIGRFWQIDPLAEKYVYNSTYAFSENKVVNAIELEGLESVIVTNTYDKDNHIVNTSTINNDKGNYGPLGDGTYTVDKKVDGTFNEGWKPANGNSVNPFYQEGLSQSRWTNGEDQGGYSLRLSGRLIEKQVEDGLVSMGFNEKQVQKDVSVLESDDPSFKGRFATFESGVASKYTSGWSSSTPSSPHKSILSYESKELFNSDVAIKVYDGARSLTDRVPVQIGLVRVGAFDHRSEALDAVLFKGVNIGLRNAIRLKNNQENK